MTYSAIQQKWLKYHWRKWNREYGWDAATFAQRTQQPAEALADVLGIPLAEFGPREPPHQKPLADPTPLPTPPAALPTPETATVIIEPGVELLPREQPSASPPSPPPPPTTGEVLLAVGRHVIDGQNVDIPGARGHSVWYPLPWGKHVIDNVIVNVPRPGHIRVHATGSEI